jgi:AcrR family transcriptional regulator
MAPKKTYQPNAKERILNTAAAVFAQTGFNGSRVDQIAKAANVPKSLIYYHFKSKDAILDELVDTCLTRYGKIMEAVARQAPDKSSTDDLLERIRTVYWKFLEENEDVVRIISMESLKKNSPRAGLAFKFAELLIAIEKQYIRETGALTPEEENQHLVAEFFTSQIPVVLFFCLRDTFCESFNVDAPTLSDHFLKAYDATYGAYRRHNFKL